MKMKIRAHTVKREQLILAALILTAGPMGLLLSWAVGTSGYFPAVNHLSNAQFYSFAALWRTALVAGIGALGLGLTFAGGKFSNELWDSVRGVGVIK
jgi:hypothetical protein